MNIKVHETYASDLFEDFYECRNSEGFLIGCGRTAEEAEADAKTAYFVMRENIYKSFNYRMLNTAKLKR